MKRFNVRDVYCGKTLVAAAALGISGDAAVYVFRYLYNYVFIYLYIII